MRHNFQILCWQYRNLEQDIVLRQRSILRAWTVEGSLRVMRPDDIVKQPNAMFCERVCSHPGLQDRTCLMGMGFADAAKLLDSFRLGSIFLLLFCRAAFLYRSWYLSPAKYNRAFWKILFFVCLPIVAPVSLLLPTGPTDRSPRVKELVVERFDLLVAFRNGSIDRSAPARWSLLLGCI